MRKSKLLERCWSVAKSLVMNSSVLVRPKTEMPSWYSEARRRPASPVLVSLLEGAAAVWNEATVEIGLMLSGEKLVDNVDFREQLKAISGGEAIGGEMEGIGLVVAAAEKPTHWVVVKAICDWADGKKSEHKEERQSIAAKNAVSFVFRALQIVPDDEEK